MRLTSLRSSPRSNARAVEANKRSDWYVVKDARARYTLSKLTVTPSEGEAMQFGRCQRTLASRRPSSARAAVASGILHATLNKPRAQVSVNGNLVARLARDSASQ